MGGAREIAQSVKCVPHKHGDLGEDFWNQHKKLCMGKGEPEPQCLGWGRKKMDTVNL